MDEADYKRRVQAQGIFAMMTQSLPEVGEDAIRGTLAMAVQAANKAGISREDTLRMLTDEFEQWAVFEAIQSAQAGVKS